MLFRPSHSTVIAYLALFIALGGSSYAAVKLKRNAVISSHIRNGHVKRADGFVPFYWLRVPQEEQMMRRQFGTAYDDYVEQTGAIVPRPGTIRRK